MKRFVSTIICIVLIFAVCCQSMTANAVFAVDDVLLASAIILNLAAVGITVYNVGQFVNSPAFNGMVDAIATVEQERIEFVTTAGKAFVAVGSLWWRSFANWCKEKFSGKSGRVDVDFDLQGVPNEITLLDGNTVPYNAFMTNPFILLPKAGGGYFGYYVQRGADDSECGVYIGSHLLQFYTQGTGKVNRVDFVNNAWTLGTLTNMQYGITYKGATGSVYSVNFAQNYEITTDKIKYRTIEAVFTNGTIDTQWGEKNDIHQATTVTQSFDVDADRMIDAVDGPAGTIANGARVLTELPRDLVSVDASTGEQTIVTNETVVREVFETVNVEEIRSVVQATDTTVEGVVDDVITDTPANSLTGEGDNIEIANKFKLPKSFLEGFPFSIPYSIFVGMKSFVAEPTAPVFDIPFKYSKIGLDYNMHIDLAQFNAVARLARALLAFVWVAGLAVGCNKFIKR